jgi:hypothetical protein
VGLGLDCDNLDETHGNALLCGPGVRLSII